MGHFVDILTGLLEDYPPGPCDGVVLDALAQAWPELAGSAETRMDSLKVSRAEDLVWQPPHLTFRIERHGGATYGSTRAELYEWVVNVQSQSTEYRKVGFRQLRPADKRMDYRPVAEELAEIVASGQDDERVVWKTDDRSAVRVLVADIVTANNKQTLASRRARFRSNLIDALGPKGWRERSPHYWVRKS